MIRQIEIDAGEARRSAALMGMVVILTLAIFGVVVLRGLEQTASTATFFGNYFADIR